MKAAFSAGRNAAAAVLLALALSACSNGHSGPSGPSWGANASFAPGWHRLGVAVVRAAADPFTWAPAAGAAILQAGNLDNDIAAWANEKTPVFGGRRTARSASDWLRTTSLALYAGTGLAAPVAPGEDWLGAKAGGFAAGGAAIAATAAATGLLKEAVGRERPLGQDDASFPSRHAALAAVGARLSRETLRHYDLAPGARIASDAGLAGLALMTGWARVEAGMHHPADVLAGAAIGNFLAVLASEALLRPAQRDTVALNVHPVGDGWMVHAALAF